MISFSLLVRLPIILLWNLPNFAIIFLGMLNWFPWILLILAGLPEKILWDIRLDFPITISSGYCVNFTYNSYWYWLGPHIFNIWVELGWIRIAR